MHILNPLWLFMIGSGLALFMAQPAAADMNLHGDLLPGDDDATSQIEIGMDDAVDNGYVSVADADELRAMFGDATNDSPGEVVVPNIGFTLALEIHCLDLTVDDDATYEAQYNMWNPGGGFNQVNVGFIHTPQATSAVV